MSSGSDTLDRLAKVLRARRKADPEQSYVARLHARGIDAVLKKVGEEATEVVLAAKNGDNLVHESADLLFHLMVLLDHCGLDHHSVLQELDRRFGRSGLEEKAARHSTHS